MQLNNAALENRDWWEKAGFELPGFDREEMLRVTEAAPEWVHFGAGNIFRIFPAALQQSLLEQGLAKTGIVVAEGYDTEIIDKAFLPYDNLTLAVTLKADGSAEKNVIASVASALRLDTAGDFNQMKAIFCKPSLQMASFTITEKGYMVAAADGVFFPAVAADMEAGPGAVKSYMGRICALCYERFLSGEKPLAMVSMDNCSHNGDKLALAMDAFAQGWTERGLVERGFAAYIRDRTKVSFPLTMIDKITPWPNDGVRAMLEKAGVTGIADSVTAKNTRVAPFVNAEETQYLVIEDVFPAGRPPLEKAGVLFTDRETVDKVEKMKVCTCLNPLHTALAIFGCLLKYTKISEEMKNPDLVKLVEIIGYKEGLPVVVDPGIISPKDFLDTVLKVRFPNPFMPDTPQRIATDSSQKISIRFGETIKAYLANPALKTEDLRLIPLVLAAWIRYLLGVDDTGCSFTPSPDPLYESLASALAGIKLGQKGPFHVALEPILSNKKIFAVNLYEAGLGERVEAYFEELMTGPGAVAGTLKKYVNQPGCL